MHALRVAPFFNESAISISNVKNLMDPVFVDSSHSSRAKKREKFVVQVDLPLETRRPGLPAERSRALRLVVPGPRGSPMARASEQVAR
jgi:hypothetical protein